MKPTPKKKFVPSLVPCVCPACINHSGFSNAKREQFCPACVGGGTVERPLAQTLVCPACNGSTTIPREVQKTKQSPAAVVDDPCPDCAATGRVRNPAFPFRAAAIDNSTKARLARMEARLLRLEASASESSAIP